MRSHHLVAARVESPGVGWSRAKEMRRRGEPPGRGEREIQKLLHVPSLKARQNLILSPEVAPRPLGDEEAESAGAYAALLVGAAGRGNTP